LPGKRFYSRRLGNDRALRRKMELDSTTKPETPFYSTNLTVIQNEGELGEPE
jgi:hypothetical protein